ncbi:MAG: hypothetical protein OXF68_01820 [Gammaproteobacteria bacterium]|nr:hypothetical protein [Gammaproteobacteria bacterium]
MVRALAGRTAALAHSGLLLHHANLGRRRARGVAGYCVGGRSAGGIVIGVSFFATFASTNSYIGNVGKAYDYGLSWLAYAEVMVLFTWLSWTAGAGGLWTIFPTGHKICPFWAAGHIHADDRGSEIQGTVLGAAGSPRP